VALKWIDKRVRPEAEPIPTNWTMREYQEPAVQKLVKVGRGSLSAGTGSGKSSMCIETFARLGVRGVVMVPTQIIWGQFIKTAIQMFLNDGVKLPKGFNDMGGKQAWKWAQGKTRIPIGIIGQSDWEPGFLTIAIAASLDGSKRSREFLNSVKFMWADESHHLAADTWFNALMRTEAYYRFGGSGTVMRTDGQDLKLFATTGPVIYTITTSELIRLGWLAKPIIKMHKCDISTIGDPSRWADYYRANVVYDPKRVEIIVGLIRQSVRENIKTLCLVGWDEHAANILSRIGLDYRRHIDYVKAGHGKSQVKEAIGRFANNEIRVLIATPLLSEGYDLCSIDRLIRASAMQSPIRVTQETGRVLRVENAPRIGVCTEVHDFYDIDRGGPLSKHSKERYEAWKAEEEFDVTIDDTWMQRSFDDLIAFCCGTREEAEQEIRNGNRSELDDGPEPSKRVTELLW
jgi:superfamily II DNA or RNA helicase